MAAWDRSEKPHPRTGKPWQEPPRAYQHFTIYRDLGPGRTLEKTAEIQGVKLHTLEGISYDWNWVSRCDQWDAHVQALQQRAYLDEAAKRARQRAQAYTALLTKSLQALQQVDLEKATLAQIAAAMKVAVEGMRLEEGLETARVSMEVQDARTLLARLPVEVRREVIRALDSAVRAGEPETDRGLLPAGTG